MGNFCPTAACKGRFHHIVCATKAWRGWLSWGKVGWRELQNQIGSPKKGLLAGEMTGGRDSFPLLPSHRRQVTIWRKPLGSVCVWLKSPSSAEAKPGPDTEPGCAHRHIITVPSHGLWVPKGSQSSLKHRPSPFLAQVTWLLNVGLS